MPLFAGLAIGAAAVFGYMAISSSNNSPSVSNVPAQQNNENSSGSQNTGGGEGNTNVYNEDDSYEEEVTPQQPSGHYEQRCMRTYQSGGYDQFGNFIDGQWVEQCRDVWVQD